MATMLRMTATVKTIDTQRWNCRIHSFQFKRTSWKDETEGGGHAYKSCLNPWDHELRRAHEILASKSTSFPLIIFQP